MPKYSEARLRGIDMRSLYLELPTHPNQVKNRKKAEERGRAYWEYRRLVEGETLKGFELERAYEEKYASEIPEKTKVYASVKFVGKGGPRGKE